MPGTSPFVLTIFNLLLFVFLCTTIQVHIISGGFFYPALTGSKIPTSKFSESKEIRWGRAARKSPIGEGKVSLYASIPFPLLH